jgi:hypothetical protein
MKTRRTVPTLLILILTLPLLQACDATSAWEGTITDSAGISVVHNTTVPLWGPGEGWTFTEDLRIGTVAGEPEYQFGQIFPVGSMDVDEEGNIYVIDVQAQEARVFDPQGVFLRSMGGPGSGPGELSQAAFYLFTDNEGRTFIPDLGNQRVSIFDPSGEPSGSFPIQLQAGVPALWRVDNTGRVLAQLRAIPIPGVEISETMETGDPIVVYDTTGAVVDTLAILPKGETLQGISEQGLDMVMFAPEPFWNIDDQGRILYGTNDQYKILVNDTEGNLIRIITREVEKTRVEESDKEAIMGFLREFALSQGAPPAQVDQIFGGMGFAEYYPVIGLILMGPEGSIWAQRTRTGRDIAEAAEESGEVDIQEVLGSPDWDVFDADGRWLGPVTLPARFQPVVVKGDQVYGVWADELDVQYIMRLTVNR